MEAAFEGEPTESLYIFSRVVCSELVFCLSLTIVCLFLFLFCQSFYDSPLGIVNPILKYSNVKTVFRRVVRYDAVIEVHYLWLKLDIGHWCVAIVCSVKDILYIVSIGDKTNSKYIFVIYHYMSYEIMICRKPCCRQVIMKTMSSGIGNWSFAFIKINCIC